MIAVLIEIAFIATDFVCSLLRGQSVKPMFAEDAVRTPGAADMTADR